ncbi:MAG: ferredoxin--NADP reductase [Planctomycetota bacterium]|nr:MAG: ferredoxin--NADP reductase [Planctomycetota bacterium]
MPVETPLRNVCNATLILRQDLTEELAVFRIQPDGPLFSFQAGQYTVIGLPAEAPRHPSADPEDEPPKEGRLLRRAYSIASSSKNNEYVELYITLVRSGALTPRLWMLREGDRLWLGPKAKGHFTMDDLPEERDVVLVGTGTGLAPYIAMIRDHHRCNRGRRFIVVHGARYVRELGYREDLEALHRDCATFLYLPTVSRPQPDAPWTGHVGRVQSVFEDGALEAALGGPVSPEGVHVFLSGNPAMVEDMQERLLRAGFTLHAPRSPGTLHVERYW